LQTKPAFSEAAASLLASDVWARLELARSRRKRDAEWFCGKFGINL
jgi:hypothetical protein